MSEEYNPHEIEARWRAHWDATRRDQFDLDGVSRPFYDLMEFPYPSGEGVIITRSTPRHAPCLHILAASSRRLSASQYGGGRRSVAHPPLLRVG